MIQAEKLQAVILTKNEGLNIARVLNKLQWIEKIVVIDSFSTDETLEIINAYPNTILHQRVFDTHANQWNYGLSLCTTTWILSLDADYVLNDEVTAEIISYIKEDAVAAYHAQFNFLVFGKPLRSNNTTPRPVLFQKNKCYYYDDGHTQRLYIDGKEGNFKNKIDHDDRKPLSRWLLNQASYSLKECQMLTNTPKHQLSFTAKILKKESTGSFFCFFLLPFCKGINPKRMAWLALYAATHSRRNIIDSEAHRT